MLSMFADNVPIMINVCNWRWSWENSHVQIQCQLFTWGNTTQLKQILFHKALHWLPPNLMAHYLFGIYTIIKDMTFSTSHILSEIKTYEISINPSDLMLHYTGLNFKQRALTRWNDLINLNLAPSWNFWFIPVNKCNNTIACISVIISQ